MFSIVPFPLNQGMHSLSTVRDYPSVCSGNTKRRSRSLESALKINPSIADAWVVMSNSCFMLGRLEESARAFDQAYYLDVKDARTGMVKGLSLLKIGKVDDAIRSFSNVWGILLR